MADEVVERLYATTDATVWATDQRGPTFRSRYG